MLDFILNKKRSRRFEKRNDLIRDGLSHLLSASCVEDDLVGGPQDLETRSELGVTVRWVKSLVVREVGCGWKVRPLGSLTQQSEKNLSRRVP